VGEIFHEFAFLWFVKNLWNQPGIILRDWYVLCLPRRNWPRWRGHGLVYPLQTCWFCGTKGGWSTISGKIFWMVGYFRTQHFTFQCYIVRSKTAAREWSMSCVQKFSPLLSTSFQYCNYHLIVLWLLDNTHEDYVNRCGELQICASFSTISIFSQFVKAFSCKFKINQLYGSILL